MHIKVIYTGFAMQSEGSDVLFGHWPATCHLHVGLSPALEHGYPCRIRVLFRFGKACSRVYVMHSLYNGSSSLDS